MPSLPGASSQICVPFTSASATCLRLNLTSGGVLQLQDASGTTRASSTALATNTGYRFEVYGDTNGCTLDIYAQGTTTLLQTLPYAATAAFGANLNNLRFGLIVGITGGFTAYYDSIVLLSGAQSLGDWAARA
jgi:hypothetical protein